MVLPKNGSANRSLLRPTLFIYNVYKVQNSINHMLNPSADRDVNNNYRLSTEKARQWWRNQAFESRKNIVIESEAVINEDELVEDQIIADIADKDYDDLPDITKQEIELQVDNEEEIEEVFEVQGEEYLQCSTCDDLFTSNEDYDIHRSIDHGEEPVDVIEETYRLSVNKDLTKESIRDANTLLTETEERELYAGYNKTNGITPRVMPPNQRVEGKYDNNPNEFFYSNKIFRNGSSTERNSVLGESKATEEFDISKYYKEVTEDDGWLDYQCNSCGKKIEADDGYGDKDYDVIIQELKDHQINHKFIYESKANEDSIDDDDREGRMQWITDAGNQDPITDEEAELLLYGTTDGSKGGTWTGNVSRPRGESKASERLARDDEETYTGYYSRPKDAVRQTGNCPDCGHDVSAHSGANTGDNLCYGGGNDGDCNCHRTFPWIIESVEYKDDGVSDISVQNTEPKEDKNEFLDDIDISEEAVDYVYPTKANESTKSYITESDPFEEEYEEFEDSDEEVIEETISIRKLTGYSDNSIAQELHINYGVSHEEALEKVYSVEVSTNDKVSQTFFGKMYKECTESEKDELRMYSGSD